VQIATTGGPKRSPFFQHVFVGGNAFMVRMLQANAETLQTTASAEQFERTITLTEQQMATQAAKLSLEGLQMKDGVVSGEIAIQSQVGHKFPGGYPSRRAWLHITLLDGEGKVVFESGAVQPDGLILGNDNDEDPAQFEAHYTTLTEAGQVQIYEAIMLDTDGNVTTNLLRGASYAKDNRLLPAGFDPQTAAAPIAVYGEAAQDEDFASGGDRLALAIDLGAAQGPLTLRVELLYQSIAYRWADNLRKQASAEAQAFAGFYAAMDNLPLVAAQVETLIQP
jgi:hypothetical protein